MAFAINCHLKNKIVTLISSQLEHGLPKQTLLQGEVHSPGGCVEGDQTCVKTLTAIERPKIDGVMGH